MQVTLELPSTVQRSNIPDPASVTGVKDLMPSLGPLTVSASDWTYGV